MAETVVEYLVVVNRTDAFCESASAFNRLLQVNSAISIKKGEIQTTNGFVCDYKIAEGEVSGKDQLYLHLRFAKELGEAPSDDDIDKFQAMLKLVHLAVHKAGSKPEILWDDISFHYSYKSYPLIHEIENLMRKLIVNFMLVTVGKGWVDETSPNEIKEAIRDGKGKDRIDNYANVLHGVDFIQLADFLLKPYSNVNQPELHAQIQEASSLEDIGRLKAALPASNWKRYFSSVIECDDGYLRKRWDRLYKLRCKVAHNAIVTRQDFRDISQLVDELKPTLLEAIGKLPQVIMPPEDKEVVAENAAATLSTVYGEFVMAWRRAEEHITEALESVGEDTQANSLRALDLLRVHGVLSERHHNRLMWLRRFRNQIVHPSGNVPPEESVHDWLAELDQILSEWQNSQETKDRIAVNAVSDFLGKMYPFVQQSHQRDHPHIFLHQGDEHVAVDAMFVPVINTENLIRLNQFLTLGEGLVASGNIDKFVLAVVCALRSIAEVTAESGGLVASSQNSDVWVGFIDRGVFIPVTNRPSVNLLFDK